jgi:hypothetical protein
MSRPDLPLKLLTSQKNTFLIQTTTKNLKTQKQYEVPLILNLPSHKAVNIKIQGITITSKTSGHEETFHTGDVACCTDVTKLLPLLMDKRKMMSNDEISCGLFMCI